jgi:hypothetical protein
MADLSWAQEDDGPAEYVCVGKIRSKNSSEPVASGMRCRQNGPVTILMTGPRHVNGYKSPRALEDVSKREWAG